MHDPKYLLPYHSVNVSDTWQGDPIDQQEPIEDTEGPGNCIMAKKSWRKQ